MVHSIVEQDRELPYFQQLWRILLLPDVDFGSRVARLFADETVEFGLDCAFLSRIDLEDETQHFEIIHEPYRGLEAGKTVPLEETYCRKTIAEPERTMVIDDALAEGWEDDPAYERFKLRTYVGTTVTVEDGLYGTLCFADPEPRDEPITSEEKGLVEMHGKWVSYELNRWAGPAVNEPVDIDEGGIASAQIDRMMEALKTKGRRAVLLNLLDSTEISIDSLKRTIDVKNIDVRLYHVHLPKLDQTGYIQWDRDAGTISRGRRYLEAEPLLRLLQDYRTSS